MKRLVGLNREKNNEYTHRFAEGIKGVLQSTLAVLCELTDSGGMLDFGAILVHRHSGGAA
jgi:hypothetical protein